MVRIGTVVMGASDVRRAAAFWKAALQYTEREPGTDDWVVLVPVGGPGVGLSLGRSASPVQEVPRVHLDLYSDTQEAEVERLIGLGAERVAWGCIPRTRTSSYSPTPRATASASSTRRTAAEDGPVPRREGRPLRTVRSPHRTPRTKRQHSR